MCNITLFVVVLVWRFTFWGIERITVLPPDRCADLGCASSLCADPMLASITKDGQTDTESSLFQQFYSAEVHTFLSSYSAQTRGAAVL